MINRIPLRKITWSMLGPCSWWGAIHCAPYTASFSLHVWPPRSIYVGIPRELRPYDNPVCSGETRSTRLTYVLCGYQCVPRPSDSDAVLHTPRMSLPSCLLQQQTRTTLKRTIGYQTSGYQTSVCKAAFYYKKQESH